MEETSQKDHHKTIRNTILYISDLLLTHNFEPLVELSGRGSCVVLVVGFLEADDLTSGISISFLHWLPYYRFILHFAHPDSDGNVPDPIWRFLQTHRDLFKLISTPNHNRFDQKYLNELTEYNFNTEQLKKLNSNKLFIEFDFPGLPYFEFDVILQFASLLKFKGLKIVFVAPPAVIVNLLYDLKIGHISFDEFNEISYDHRRKVIQVARFDRFAGGSKNDLIVIPKDACKEIIEEEYLIEVCKEDFLLPHILERVFAKIDHFLSV